MQLNLDKIPVSLGESSLFRELAEHYAYAPSAIIIRTAEIEILRTMDIASPALDLCCGDGYFASLLGSGIFDAGCDFSENAMIEAVKRGMYNKVCNADITKGIDFEPQSFNTIVSNSALEHVADIDAALKNVRDLLKPGGHLIFTLASDCAYKWWPCGQNEMKKYLSYQPVFNYFSLEEWKVRLKNAGLNYRSHQYYLSRSASRLLFYLDYHYSNVYLTSDKTMARPIIRTLRRVPRRVLSWFWRNLFSSIKILADDEGGGILVIARREDR